MSNYEWNKPVKEWDDQRHVDFFKWAMDAYGEEPFKEMLQGYRAVMDIQQQEPPERYNFGWTDARGVFANGS